MRDFTDSKVYKKTYGGTSRSKICVEIDGERYMLKFPRKTPNKNYDNACISEHIGCSIYRELGIATQETMLGTYNTNGKEKIVVACKNIDVDGYRLYDFACLKNAVLNSSLNGHVTELDDILWVIENQTYLDKTKLKHHFCEMFVIDCFIGNHNRNNENWGFLYNEQTDEIKIAPIYACGSCLYPQISESMMRKIISDENEISSIIYDLSTTAIKINNQNIKYYDFLMSTDDKDFIKAIVAIHDKINMHDINDIVIHTDGISDLQREFYVSMLAAAYSKIIEPAYERACIPLKNAIKTQIFV